MSLFRLYNILESLLRGVWETERKILTDRSQKVKGELDDLESRDTLSDIELDEKKKTEFNILGAD